MILTDKDMIKMPKVTFRWMIVPFVPLNIENTALEFSNQLVKDTSIMTLPAEMFEYEGKYIRVGFGRENFPEALHLLADYLT